MLQEPGVLVRPDDFIAAWRAVALSEHADVECVDAAKLSVCEFLAIGLHPPTLGPFLEPFHGDQFRCENGLEKQGKLVQGSEALALVDSGVDYNPCA